MKRIFNKPVQTIGICAPSAQFNRQDFEKGIRFLEEIGYKPTFSPDIFQKDRYLAGDDLTRARSLLRLFEDKEVDALICARGGYGSMRIIEHLDWRVIRENPKPIIGFSDATALLLSVIEQTGIPVIHGPNLISLPGSSNSTIESFKSSLKGITAPISLDQCHFLYEGRAEGILKGGNLSTINHLTGTPYQPDFSGCILFLEDTGEQAYKIDRMLSQLKMSGSLDNLKGVLFGTFQNCDFDHYKDQIFKEIFKPMRIPLVSGLTSGHGHENLSLVMGLRVEIDTDSRTLTWEEEDH